MRSPYQRPWPATFFYVLAGLTLLIYLLLGGIVIWGGGTSPENLPIKDAEGIFKALGVWFVIVGVLISSVIAAIGYVIELIAKIEWNTRPPSWATGDGHVPTAAPLGVKLYYYIDKGPLVGPMTAPDILNLVRDGKLSIATRYFVEENGQRRPLANLSDINF
jgi:hypothetical protein